MREKVKDKGRLEHILQACTTLLDNKDKYDFETAKNDPVIFYGFVKLVEIIGEASYMLTKEFCTEHPQVPWSAIVGMRHVLVHGYYTIEPIDLWKTIQNDIPTLQSQILNLLETVDFPEEPQIRNL